MELSSGKIVGPYRVEREVGRGGMGVVYLAIDTRLDREVAIKALPAELAQDAARLERFEREAKTLAQLSHPNLAGIYGVEEQDGARYLVLEYVEGETLADRLDRGALPLDDALEFAAQICAGVEAAHEAGVVHRDLKPANIKITSEGRAKVLDFGLARSDGEAMSSSGLDISNSPTISSPVQHSPTIPGAIMGTAPYMSPEQARGRRVDKRTDIWSFGVVLYEMLTGIGPFHGETATDSIGAILHKDVDLGLLPKGTPVGVRRVLKRCLERDKAKRYRDIGDVGIDLAHVREDGFVDDGGPASARGKGKGLLVGMVCAFALGIAGWYLGGLRSEPDGLAPVMHLSIPLPDGLEIVGPIEIARDGSKVVFAGVDEDGEAHIYLRDLDGFGFRRVEGSREGNSPFFSPDGASIVFHARNYIWRASVEGGPPTELIEATIMVGASWMEDDTILYSTGFDSPIKRMTSGGSPLESVSNLEALGAYAHVWPEHIPGTDRVLYTAWGGESERGGGYGVDMKTGVATRLTESTTFSPSGRWSMSGHMILDKWSDGLFVASVEADSDEPIRAGAAKPLLSNIHHLDNATRSLFAISDTGVLAYVPAVTTNIRLVRVDPDGITAPILEQSDAGGRTRLGLMISLSRDGKRALVGGGGDIIALDLERGIPRRLTFEERNDINPVWSHDEKHVYFSSNREERWKIWSVPIDGGSPPEVLIEHQHNAAAPSVGPNGEVLFVVTDPETTQDIWIREADGKQRAVLRTAYREAYAAISPDGARYAYQSDVSGIAEVYIGRIDGKGAPVQVTRGGGSHPRWSGDGATLHYRKGRSVMQIAIEAGQPVGEETRVFPAENLQRGGSYAVSADGERMYAIEVDDDAIPDEIRVITNFFPEIERVAPTR